MNNFIDKFSDDVIKKLGFYVYRLIDPRTGHTFYVGKGKGNRVFDHVKTAILNPDDKDSLKYKTIQQIISEGHKVLHIIQRWGMTEDEAILVESALIDCYFGLTNIQSGHNSEYGVASAFELQKRLAVEEYTEPCNLPYVIIKIKQQYLEERGSVYETTRKAWAVSLNNIKNYKYVVSVLNGIVVGVFEVERWQYAVNDRPSRVEFIGHEAPKDITDIFINKRIPAKYCKKGMASPVLYSKNV